MDRYIKYSPITRDFFSQNELKNLVCEKKVFQEISIDKCADNLITDLKHNGWQIEKEVEIKDCPTYYLKKDNNKLVFILARMDQKVYYYSQKFQKTKQLEDVKHKILQQEKKYDDRDLIKYYHSFFIQYKNGTTIFEYIFREQKIDSDLFTSSLSAICDVIKEATGNLTNIKEIVKENLFILIENDELFSTILISETNVPQVRDKLKEFNKKFLKRYENELKNWTGEVNRFKGTIDIIREIFKIEKDDSLKLQTTKQEDIYVGKEELKKEEPKKEEFLKSEVPSLEINEGQIEYDEIKNNKTYPEPILKENIYYYYCPNCNQWYKVEFKREYNCIYCGNILLDKTDEVKKYQQ